MMECMEEFDEATPLKATYCSRLNAEEYEAQGASCTEKALAELLQHLEQRPEAYTSVLKKRRKDEVENERGMVTYFKMKLFSLVGVEDQACSVPDVECEEQLDKLKADMMKAYSYSQESKGRRYSRRLAEKRNQTPSHPSSSSSPSSSQHSHFSSTPLRHSRRSRSQKNYIPPPPPPPPLPPSLRVPLPRMGIPASTALLRHPLAERRDILNSKHSCSEPQDMFSLISQLKGSGCRKRLRKTVQRSPGGTPITGWPPVQGPANPEGVSHFNQMLLEKFKNVKSPSPGPCYTMASPGTYDSPI